MKLLIRVSGVFLLLTAILLFGQCKSSKRTNSTNAMQEEIDKQKAELESLENQGAEKPPKEEPRFVWEENVIVDKEFTMDKSGDHIDIAKLWMEGDNLNVRMSFSGGCETHEFKLYTNGKYLKSLPPKLKLILWHDNKKDACRGVVKADLRFNLKEARYPRTNKLMVTVNNASDWVAYAYE